MWINVRCHLLLVIIVLLKGFTRGGGGVAASFDPAAFGKDIIAPVKKSVNHSKTVTSMCEMRRIRAILSVATRRWKIQSNLVIVYLL